MDSWINGLGNLLLLMPGENSSESNKHPADKKYSSHLAGSYEQHRTNKDRWLDPRQWTTLIETRGNDIYRFMLDYFDIPPAESSSALAA